MLKMDDIILTQQLKIVYEFKNNLLPSELQNLFTYSSDVHIHETVSASNDYLFIPRILTVDHGNQSLKYKGPFLWNKMFKVNPKIKECKSVSHLKYILKKHFLACYEKTE